MSLVPSSSVYRPLDVNLPSDPFGIRKDDGGSVFVKSLQGHNYTVSTGQCQKVRDLIFNLICKIEKENKSRAVAERFHMTPLSACLIYAGRALDHDEDAQGQEFFEEGTLHVVSRAALFPQNVVIALGDDEANELQIKMNFADSIVDRLARQKPIKATVKEVKALRDSLTLSAFTQLESLIEKNKGKDVCFNLKALERAARFLAASLHDFLSMSRALPALNNVIVEETGITKAVVTDIILGYVDRDWAVIKD